MGSTTSISEIRRRIAENDPVEIRHVYGIALPVFGWVDGSPVYRGEDHEKCIANMDRFIRCHYCRDTGRVYLHGEEKEPDVSRRGPGTPCPACTSK